MLKETPQKIMKPSDKTPEMEDALSELFGIDRRDSIRANRCIPPPIGCGKEVNPDEFRDEISRKEFCISGLCQECQDKVFGT